MSFWAQILGQVFAIAIFAVPVNAAPNPERMPPALACEYIASGADRFQIHPVSFSDPVRGTMAEILNLKTFGTETPEPVQANFLGGNHGALAFEVSGTVYKRQRFMFGISDLLSQAALMEFSDKYFHVNKMQFALVETVSLHSGTMVITSPYISGRPLIEVLTDPQTPPKVRTELIKIYGDFIQRVKDRFMGNRIGQLEIHNDRRYYKNYTGSMEGLPPAYWFDLSNGLARNIFPNAFDALLEQLPAVVRSIAYSRAYTVEFILKVDNIIVDENFNLHLIDPI